MHQSWPKFTDDIKTCGRIMMLEPVVESLPAIVPELVPLGAHSQRVLTSAPSSGIITECNDVCSFIKDLVDLVCHWSSRSSCLSLIFQTCINISGSVIGAGRWEGSEDGGWLENKDYDLRELLAHFHHLEYIAAKKSWMAGSTAEGGQSVIKSVANLTTLNIPLRRCAPT